MRVRVEFTCELPFNRYDLTPWFQVNDELNHTNLEQVNDLEVAQIDNQGEMSVH